MASAIRRFASLELLDNRYPALHGLRVLAILTVIQFHMTWMLGSEQRMVMQRDLVDLSLAVFFGMDLFFILSGFLIGSILFHSIDVAGTPQLGRFYLRRMFRTFPAYWIVLTFLSVTSVLNGAQRAHLPYEYAYLTNFMPMGRENLVMLWGWSLALEEQFYLVVPFFLYALTKLRSDRGRVALLVSLALVCLGLRLAVWWHGRPWDEYQFHDTLYFRSYARFDTLIVGILLAFVHRRWGRDLTRWLESPAHRAWLALPSLAILWALLFPSSFAGEHMQLFHVFAWGTLTSLMYVPALVLLLHTKGPIVKLLSAPIFRTCATLGYGVYLVHIPVIDALIVPLAKRGYAAGISTTWLWALGSLLAMGASLAVGWVMHLTIEKPALRLRDRLAH